MYIGSFGAIFCVRNRLLEVLENTMFVVYICLYSDILELVGDVRIEHKTAFLPRLNHTKDGRIEILYHSQKVNFCVFLI